MLNVLEKIRERGIHLDDLILDGKPHGFRWGTETKDDSKHGSYKVIQTSHGITYHFTHWKNKSLSFSLITSTKDLTPAELSEHKKRVREAEEATRLRQSMRWETARLQVEQMWNVSTESPHPYLEKKRIGAHGTKVNPYKNLLVPAYDVDGKLWSVQLIRPDGTKENIKGSKTKGCLYPIGDISKASELYIFEGFATAASFHEATKKTVACTFSAHFFYETGKALLKKYPGLKLVFSGDADLNGVGERNSRKAASLLKQRYLIPKFRSPGVGTDWNDLRNSEGDQMLMDQIIQFEQKSDFPEEQFVLESLEELNVSIDLNGSIFSGTQGRSLKQIASAIRVRAARLRESTKRGFIEDYLSEWHLSEFKKKRDLFFQQFFIKEKHDPDHTLLKTFMKALLRREDPLAFTAILHFIWQVKRKMKGMPVSHHMMPIFCGETGKGKSVALKDNFLKPLQSLCGIRTLGIFDDDRTWGYFENHLVVFFDEMAKGSKHNAERLKMVITASDFDIEPKYEGLRKAKQNSTFIGATNQTIETVIQDETGNRRFFPIDATEDTDRGTINSLDYLALWQSVDETMECPILKVIDDIKGTQEANRNKSNVEMFLARYSFQKTDQDPGPERWAIDVVELLKLYETWRRENGFDFGLNTKTLSSELKRLRIAKFESNGMTGHFLYATIPLGIGVQRVEFIRTRAKISKSGESLPL